MGTDVCVNLACVPKRTVGEGDIELGTKRISALLHQDARADAIEREHAGNGAPLDQVKLELTSPGPDGPVTESITFADLRKSTAQLRVLASHCEGCPARVADKSYGCFGCAVYPIPLAAEEWLIDLVPPSHELGGILWREASYDFNWTGEAAEALRRVGVFTSQKPVERPFGLGKVTSNALFHALIGLPALTPAHCAILLAVFGVIRLDGAQLEGESKRALQPLLALPVAERAARTSLVVPDPPEGAAHAATLLGYLYRAWVIGEKLVVMT